MFLASMILLLVMLTLSFVTLLAFSQAAANGGFENPQATAESIFDEAEPIGEPTDPNLLKKYVS